MPNLKNEEIQSTDYYVHLGLTNNLDGQQIVFVLAKFTYTFDRKGKLEVSDPEPLFNNLFDPGEEPRLKPGCEYWPYKLASDIAVQGSAHAGGQQVTQLPVSVQVGSHRKQAIVFGRRFVSYGPSGHVVFSDPEPFDTIDLNYANAYGGADWRVPVEKEAKSAEAQVKYFVDHPGLYPRNPFGKGYVVLPDHKDVDGLELPNLENPHDLLTPKRFITGNPRDWHRQPIPCCFDFLPIHVFPRCAYFGGIDGWYPAPEDSIPEVKLGILPKNYRSEFERLFRQTGKPDQRFYNEASLGLAVPYLNGDEHVLLKGFQPDGDIAFDLTGPPKIEIYIERKQYDCSPALHTLLVKTEEQKACVVWGAYVRTPRKFIEGIHKTIPIECKINNDKPIPFIAPPPIEQEVKRKQAKQGDSNLS